MILPAQDIRAMCARPQKMIYPFVDKKVVKNGKSYGLSACSYDVRICERVVIHPGEFRLSGTMERFNIPHNVMATVKDKSSYARLGLSVFNTLFDPGFRGYGTLELKNLGPDTICIDEGDPICQFVFAYLYGNTDLPYTGKYQDQAFGPQSMRIE